MKLTSAVLGLICIGSAFATIQTLNVKVANRASFPLYPANFVYTQGAPTTDVSKSKINPSDTLGWTAQLGSRFSISFSSRGPAATFDLLADPTKNSSVVCSASFDSAICPTMAFCECAPSTGLQCFINTQFTKCNDDIKALDIQFDVVRETGLCPLVKNIVRGFEWGRIGIEEDITTSVTSTGVTVNVSVEDVAFSAIDKPTISSCAIEVLKENTFALQLRKIVVDLSSVQFSLVTSLVGEKAKISGRVVAGVTAIINFESKKVEMFELWLEKVDLYDVKLNNFQTVWNLVGNTIINQLKTTAAQIIGEEIKFYIQECVGDLTTCVVPSAYLRDTTTAPPLRLIE